MHRKIKIRYNHYTMKESHLMVILAVFLLVLSVPLLIDSQQALAKKHEGPVPFPPDIIPSISHKHEKTHDVISLTQK